MSSKKVNISELDSEDMDKKRANIIYNRLKSVYDGVSSDEKLGRKLADIGKSGMKYRRDNGKYNADEIIKAFPDVNREWVFSKDLQKLRTLPVRNPAPKAPDSSQVDLGKNGLSDEAKREILARIEELLKILKNTL